MPKLRRIFKWILVAIVSSPVVLAAAYYGLVLGFMWHGFGTLTGAYEVFAENVQGDTQAAKYENLLADIDYSNSVQEFLNHKRIGGYLCLRKLHGSESEQVAALLILRSMLFANGSSPTYPFPYPSGVRDAQNRVVPVVFNQEVRDDIEAFLQIEDPGPVLAKVVAATKELIKEWEEATNRILQELPSEEAKFAPPLGAGAVAPELLAEGWLNGDLPRETELEGKVVVVDVWAYW